MDLFGVRRLPFMARRNYFYEMQHILLWGLLAGFVEGNFASVVVAKTFNGSNALIAIAATTPVAAYIASLLWGMLCIGRRKIRIMTFSAAGTVLLAASVGATPAAGWGGWLFVAQMAAAQFFLTGVVTVRSALWKSNYPAHSRGKITARIQQVRAIMRLAAVVFAARIFDLDPGSYRWLYPVAAAFGLIAVVLLQRIHVRGDRGALSRSASAAGGDDVVTRTRLVSFLSPVHLFSTTMRVVRRDKRFRSYLVAQMFGGCANLLVRAVVVTVITNHLLADVRSSYWISTVLLESLTLLVMLATMGYFAAYFDRVGVIRFRTWHGLWWSSALLTGMIGTLVVVNAEAVGPYYLPIAVMIFAAFAALRGICYGAGAIAWNLGHLHFARTEEAEVYMGIHVSLTGLRGLILPGLGMALWYAIGWVVWLIALAVSLIALLCFVMMDRQEAAEASAQLLSGQQALEVRN